MNVIIDRILTIVGDNFSVIAGLLGTLLGAWIGRAQALKIQRETASHNERQARWSKQMDMRSAIYQDVLSKATAVQTAVMGLATPGADYAKVKQALDDMTVQMSKLSVIASERTLLAAKSYVVDTAALYMAVVAESAAMVTAHALSQTAKDAAQSALAKQRQYVELAVQINLNGQRDPAAMERVQRQMDIAQQEFREHRAVQTNQESYAQQEAWRLTELVKAKAPEIIERGDDVLLAMRGDLETQIDEGIYRDLSRDAAERMKEATERIIAKIKASDPPVA